MKVLNNSFKPISYSEVDRKLFSLKETFRNYFQYVIKIFFNTELTNLVGFLKTTDVYTNKISSSFLTKITPVVLADQNK